MTAPLQGFADNVAHPRPRSGLAFQLELGRLAEGRPEERALVAVAPVDTARPASSATWVAV